MNKPLLRTAIAIALQSSIASAIAGTHTMADTMFKSADSADIAEDYTLASAKYLDLISKLRQSDPDNLIIVRAQARLARIYIFQRDFDKAEPLFHILMHTDRGKLDLEPELLIDLDDLSEAYGNLHGDPRHGLESLKRCLSLRMYINPHHPRLPEAYRSLAEYCSYHSMPTNATEWILRGIELEKQYKLPKQGPLVRDLTLLSNIYMQENNLDKAQQVIQDSLAKVAQCNCGKELVPHIHATLGRIYSRKGLFDQADKEYQLSINTSSPTAKFGKHWKEEIMRFRQENELLRKKTKGGRH
jgi:tetratricopeptide (TPR) repeat protein